MSPASVVDLHLHTTLSDGRLTPDELVRLVADRGVEVAAVTDHDTTDGLAEAFAAAERYPGLTLVPGIEISADHPMGRGDLHILGYFVDHGDPRFQGQLRDLKDERVVRAKRMVERLGELGLPVEWDRVKAIAGEASIGRPHIAQAMVERGYITSVKEAFHGYLEEEGGAYVDRARISMKETVDLIHSVGGAAVVAHPLFVKDFESLLPRFVELGIVGIEVHYAEFPPEQRAEYGRLAERFGLLPCGGSDYHALGTPGEHLPGTAGPSPEVYHALERLATRGKPRA